MDQPLCLYKGKLKEALTLVLSMNRYDQQKAITFWNDCSSHMKVIANQSLQISSNEPSSALFTNLGNHTCLEPTQCDNNIMNNISSNTEAICSQATPFIGHTLSDSIHRDNLTDQEIYVNIFSGTISAHASDDSCIEKMSPEITGDPSTDNLTMEDMNEELFRPDIEQIQSGTHTDYSTEGVASMTTTSTIINQQLESTPTVSQATYALYDDDINVDGCNVTQSNAQTIVLEPSIFNSDRTEISTLNDRPLQPIQSFTNTCEDLVDARGNCDIHYHIRDECNVFDNSDEIHGQKALYPTAKAISPLVNWGDCDEQQIQEIEREIGGDANSVSIDNNQHKCHICDKSGFSTKGNLKRHLKAHSGEKPYKCEFCDSCFTENKSLKIHKRRHTGEKPYTCQVCKKTFSQSGVLQSHMDLHNDERKFECQRCNKAFRQRSQLKLHVMRHEGIKRLECSTCKAKFLTKGDLERHRRIHTGERPYSCDICKKTFTRQQSLNEHMNRHLGSRPYSCKSCDKTFSEMSACYKHAKTHKDQELRNQSPPTSV